MGAESWEHIERSEEFRALVARRRRFVVPALAVWAAWFGTFLVLCAFGRDFMGQSIYEGFTVDYAWALSLIALTWVIAWLYLRMSTRSLEPLTEQIAEHPAATGRETFADRPAPDREPQAEPEPSLQRTGGER